MLKKLRKRWRSSGLVEQLEELGKAQEEVLLKVQTRRTYNSDENTCPPIDFTASNNIEYIDNVFVKDLSTDEQTRLGLNVFHVKIDKTTTSPSHFHEFRAQLVYVREGVVFDNVAKIRFEKGDSFFISKRNKHAVKYTKGSEIIFIYVPGLNFK